MVQSDKLGYTYTGSLFFILFSFIFLFFKWVAMKSDARYKNTFCALAELIIKHACSFISVIYRITVYKGRTEGFQLSTDQTYQSKE